MNLLVVDRRRTPWLTPWGVLGTLFVLASLLLLMLIAKVGWETSSTFNAAGLLGVLGSPGDLAAGGRSSWVASQAIIGIPVLLIALLAAFGIASLALPGTMTNYWMKYLTLPANAGKKRVAIKELRSAKDPGALLVLIDIAMDPAEDEQVRRAAAEAVTDMRQDWINGPGLESAIASDDPRGIVEVLTTAFERRGKFRAQSAFTIGRQHMRLGRYADAREWLEKARRRDAKPCSLATASIGSFRTATTDSWPKATQCTRRENTTGPGNTMPFCLKVSTTGKNGVSQSFSGPPACTAN